MDPFTWALLGIVGGSLLGLGGNYLMNRQQGGGGYSGYSYTPQQQAAQVAPNLADEGSDAAQTTQNAYDQQQQQAAALAARNNTTTTAGLGISDPVQLKKKQVLGIS